MAIAGGQTMRTLALLTVGRLVGGCKKLDNLSTSQKGVTCSLTVR